MEAAPSCRNDLEILFFGLRRSGNHGVIAWIAQQYVTPITFLNDVTPFEDPFTTFALGRIPNAVPERRLAPDVVEQLRAAHKELLLISYEDLKLPKLDGKEILPQRAQWLGESGQMRRVLLLRDFYNWFASRVRLIEKRSDNSADLLKRTPPLIKTWLVYAREFLGETAYLGADIERISYNRWRDDEAYGAALLQRLGVPVTKMTRSFVPKTGGGSSFDDSVMSDASSMELTERWKHLLDSRYADIREVLKDFREDIDVCNSKIFDLQSPF